MLATTPDPSCPNRTSRRLRGCRHSGGRGGPSGAMRVRELASEPGVQRLGAFAAPLHLGQRRRGAGPFGGAGPAGRPAAGRRSAGGPWVAGPLVRPGGAAGAPGVGRHHGAGLPVLFGRGPGRARTPDRRPPAAGHRRRVPSRRGPPDRPLGPGPVPRPGCRRLHLAHTGDALRRHITTATFGSAAPAGAVQHVEVANALTRQGIDADPSGSVAA